MKSDARALREALGFRHQLDGCKHEVMLVANVNTWELGCQYEVYPVVNLSFKGMQGCCSRQLVVVESAFKGE